MAEQGHQGLQRHTGVCQGGGVSVAQLVCCHVQGRTAGTSEPGSADRVAQAGLDAGTAGPAAMFGEQEVG